MVPPELAQAVQMPEHSAHHARHACRLQRVSTPAQAAASLLASSGSPATVSRKRMRTNHLRSVMCGP